MKLGAFLMPTHPPERSISGGQDWDLDEIEALDKLGFDEAWIGEHFTAAWEPCPAPDLLIAAALGRTKRIRLGTLGHLLPYHQPVELAHRAAYLDHLARGRYMLGVGVSALPTDHDLFGLDASGGTNRRMTFEALDIITGLWTDGPRDFAGEFWSTRKPQSPLDTLGFHLRPFQSPHPPIAIAGMTPNSANHRLAGAKGYIPVSFGVSPDPASLAQHWDTVEEGAHSAGRTANRAEWRIIRDIYVAPTDAEARALAISGIMGRCWRKFLLPLYLKLGLGPMLKADPTMPDEAITLDYLADNLWVVGTPETVARKLQALQRASGGFGVLLATSYDAATEHQSWRRSLALLAQEVLPRCAGLELAA